MKKSEIYTSDEGTCFSWRDECLATQKELAKLRDLLRWRKAGEEMPTERGYYLTLEFGKNAFLDHWPGEWKRITHWRPIGPLPAEEVKP